MMVIICTLKLTQSVILSQEEASRRGVYSPQDLYNFPATQVGESSTLKVNIRNNSSNMHEVRDTFLFIYLFFFNNENFFNSFVCLLHRN